MSKASSARLKRVLVYLLELIIGAITFGFIGLVSGGWEAVPYAAVAGGILSIPAGFAISAARRSGAKAEQAKEVWLDKRAGDRQQGEEQN